MSLLRRFGAALLLVAVAVVAAPQAASAAPTTVTVHPGESIQAAIDAAGPNTTIRVEAGIYHENLFIQKSQITLRGDQVRLRPADVPTENLCVDQDSVPGICVVGQFDQNGNLLARASNVTITGFMVDGFSADGVIGFGLRNFTANNNVFTDNGGYGVASFDVVGVTYRNNESRRNGEAGIYIGDSQNANANVRNNNSHDNRGEGLLFRDSRNGTAVSNRFNNNCAGVFALDTGAPNLGGDLHLVNNTIANNNTLCPGDEGPPFGGIGVGIIGDDHVEVRGNSIRGNAEQSGSGIPGGGVVLVDSSCFGGRAPEHNDIVNNNFLNNLPYDIGSDGSDVDTELSGNNGTFGSVVGPCAVATTSSTPAT
jgi:hypothetical protein